MPPRARLPRGISVRLRIAITAMLVVLVTLLLGAIALRALQFDSLRSNIDDSLAVRAGDVEALLRDESLPALLTIRDAEEALVQVVGPNGVIVSASANAAQAPLLIPDHIARAVATADKAHFATVPELPIEDEEFRILGLPVLVDGARYEIYVAQSLDPAREAIAALTAGLALGVPVLTLFVGLLTWLLVGRALSPVEAIRREVAEITGSGLNRRVPAPNRDDEIGRLAQTMNAMLARLEAARDQQRRFVADASHELRSPITNIRAQLEVDQARPDAADPLATQQGVLAETLRLERLVDDLLLLARSDEETPARRAAVDLDDLLFQEVARADRAGAHVTVDTSRISGGQVLGDAGQLARMVANLLENALRFATARVELSLQETGGAVRLSVADDGPGIAEQDRERIFERFTRLDASRARAAGGAGLGLAIVREIVDRHGGTVRAQASAQGGAEFLVELPAASDAADG